MSASDQRPEPSAQPQFSETQPQFSETQPPQRDELLAMAYSDQQLQGEERVQFELRLADDCELAQRVAEYQHLAVMARNARAPEPMDQEWARLRRSPLQQALSRLGLWLLLGGMLSICGVALARLWTSELSSGLKLGSAAAVLGTLLYFLAALRARLRTRAYDSYRSVRR